MLSWSSATTGDQADVSAVAAGEGDGHVPHGSALLRFASACAGADDDELAEARQALVDETDEALMVDAAAVACNFEMMTRLADSTGARHAPEVIDERADMIGVLGISDFTSRR